MNKIEILREYVDSQLEKQENVIFKRTGYVHIYTVSQNCALLARRRGVNEELATMAGMLHDIHTYTTGSSTGHAFKGAIMAQQILEKLRLTTEGETELICNAIRNHSDKAKVDAPLDEVLKDADVMQHILYNPTYEVLPKEMPRWKALCEELNLPLPK